MNHDSIGKEAMDQWQMQRVIGRLLDDERRSGFRLEEAAERAACDAAQLVEELGFVEVTAQADRPPAIPAIRLLILPALPQRREIPGEQVRLLTAGDGRV